MRGRNDGRPGRCAATRTRIGAGMSLLILAALGILVWGHSVQSVASLGIAGVAVVGIAYLLAVKYLEQRVFERARSGSEPDGGPETGNRPCTPKEHSSSR